MSELTLRGLAKSFAKTPVLRALDLDVPSGALIAILGASGSGKTTLLRLIAGFERADAGSIAVAGRSICAPGLHLPPERRHIGYVAQDGALFPHLDVAANILFGLPRAQRRDTGRAAALLRLVGLPAAYSMRDPASLSGGEQQRVALARALAPGPRLVLLDEPFSALDAGLRGQTREAVAAALRQAGATAILVTHDQAEALSMGDQVAMLRQGRLVQVAAPQTLYRAPADIETARFVGDAVVLPARAADGIAHTALGLIPLAGDYADGDCTILLRPEQIVPVIDETATAAIVHTVVFQGAQTMLGLRLADGQTILCRTQGIASLRDGDRTGLRVTGTAIAYPPLTPIRH